MKIKLITQIDDSFKEKLSKFVKEHPNGNFFHSLEYFNFYKAFANYEPIIISCVDNYDKIYGLLIAVIFKENGYVKSKFSSRCIILGGPLVINNLGLVSDFLLQELVNRVKNKSIYVEFRNLFDLIEAKEVFEQNGFKFVGHYNFILKIGNIEENFSKLNKTRRWQIKKGSNLGAKISEAKEIDEVKTFYNLLVKLYRDKVKKPLPSFSFFEHFFYSNLGKYFLVKYNNEIIGGTMCPIFCDKIYEWYHCGLDKEYKNLYPGILATWAPIEYATKHGLKYFDFLGAGPADSDYGVREFKSQFGGELVNYGRYLRINNPLLYKLGKVGLKLLQKI